MCGDGYFGPLPVTACSKKYVLVIGYYFTKWIEAFAIPDMETATVARVFVNTLILSPGLVR